MLKKTCLPPRPSFHQNPFTKTMFSPRTMFSPDTVFSIKNHVFTKNNVFTWRLIFTTEKNYLTTNVLSPKTLFSQKWLKIANNCPKSQKWSKRVQTGYPNNKFNGIAYIPGPTFFFLFNWSKGQTTSLHTQIHDYSTIPLIPCSALLISKSKLSCTFKT